MSILSVLEKRGELRPVDMALAETLKRLQPDTPGEVLLAAALASLAVTQGHAGFVPPEAWIAQLIRSPWVTQPAPSEPAQAVPLVFEHGLLYLRRYREYERQLAAHLHRLGAYPPDPPDPPELASLFERLFPDPDDPQAQAALTALRQRLVLVTGGPGTGKTTTMARVLLLALARAHCAGHEPPRMALAAPTGQAAARLAASVRSAGAHWQAQGVDPGLCVALPASGQTLHRLLGSVPDSARLTHHAGHPLQVDLLIVDEVSMIDLPLMAKLLDALADGTRLILLGDPDQLPSVDVGDVLDAMVKADASGSPIRRVHLQRSYRQHASLHLAPLAAAVREGDSARALELLRSGDLSGVHFHTQPDDLTDLAHLVPRWRALASADTPAAALARIHDLRILTAVREGPQGAVTLNARLHRLLAGADARRSRHFHGQPLVITANSHRQHLFNGDLGICYRDRHGVLLAWFASDDVNTPRAFPLAALPTHEAAFATTVHKAQGAEFDEVWLLLPEYDTPLLTRELLYTALTRARQRLHLVARESVIRNALKRHTQRYSGLAQRLAPQNA